MKTKTLLASILFLFTIGFTSCSSDDDSAASGGTNFSVPLTIGSYWDYDVVSDAGTTSDHLFVDSDVVISGNTYKKFKTTEAPTGFYSSSLNENGVRNDNNKLRLTGSINLGASQGLPTDISIDINDFIIFDPSASANATLDSHTDSFTETYNGVTLTFNYTLKSTAGENHTSYSSNGTTYNDVKSTVVSLNLTVSSILGNIMNNQEVLHSTQYLANGIGVVNTQTTFSYSIDPTIASGLGIPATTTQNQEEFLTDYQVN